MDFKTFNESKMIQEDYENKLSILLYLSETDCSLNERVLAEGVSEWANKVGLKIHKSKGLIDYAMNFAKGAGQMFIAAVKGDKDKIKELANSITKEEVIDFLLKLDMATMHLLTGPIHFIDAVTGWDLAVNLKKATKKAGDYMDEFKKALITVKDGVSKLFKGKNHSRVMNSINKIEAAV